MSRKSITGGVVPAGRARIRFDFTIDRQRFRPTLRWIPNEANLGRARTYLSRIKAQIEAGTFCFADEFPHYRGLHKLPRTLQQRSCGESIRRFSSSRGSPSGSGRFGRSNCRLTSQDPQSGLAPALGRTPVSRSSIFNVDQDRRRLYLQQEDV